MRGLVIGVRLLVLSGCSALAVAACGPLPGAATPTPSAAAGPVSPGAGGPRLTGQACAVLTVADVQSAVGVPVSQVPMSAAPPAGGPGGTLVSGCNYAASGSSAAGASLFLFRDLPISYFGSVPGFQPVSGIGDRAYLQVPVIVGQKGHTTFQLILVSQADDATKARTLRALAAVVAGRL
ncbi:MAG TPA: hypothetical protein VKF59_08165 [Candidatus Dormibacteraeota bacterium]|nr:hypothetical protein [Candidatus Dormibacteraeota bacterium]